MNRPAIILFAYNRPDNLRTTIESLRQCAGANDHDLHVFSDGPKDDPADRDSVARTREVLADLDRGRDFRSVTTTVRETNLGLAASVIRGVTEIAGKYRCFVVLEDDLLMAKGFLQFMDHALEHYQDMSRVWCVNGASHAPDHLVIPKDYEHGTYLTYRNISYGWGCWSDRWGKLVWDFWILQETYTSATRELLARGGNDLPPMFEAAAAGRIDSWAVRFTYNMVLHHALALAPVHSHVFCQTTTTGPNVTGAPHSLQNELFRAAADSLYPPFLAVDPRIGTAISSIYGLPVTPPRTKPYHWDFLACAEAGKRGSDMIALAIPWISFPAAERLDRLIRSGCRILEYGSGGSTLFFLERGAIVTSVEDDPAWHGKVAGEIAKRGFLNRADYRLIPSEEGMLASGFIGDENAYAYNRPQDAGRNFFNYVTACDEFPDGHFDLVMIDGRARASCVKHAVTKLKAGGWLVIDNCEVFNIHFPRGLPAAVTGWQADYVNGPTPFMPNFDTKNGTGFFHKPGHALQPHATPAASSALRVVLGSNAAGIEPNATLLASLLHHTLGTVHVRIFSRDLQEIRLESGRLTLEVIRTPDELRVEGRAEAHGHSAAAFDRLAAIKICTDWDRAVVFDYDQVVVGDPSELFAMELGDALAAVRLWPGVTLGRVCGEWWGSKVLDDRWRECQTYRFFHMAPVLNLAAMRKAGTYERLLAFHRDANMDEQAAFCAACEDRVIDFDPKLNWFPTWDTIPADAKVLHYVRAKKPWTHPELYGAPLWRAHETTWEELTCGMWNPQELKGKNAGARWGRIACAVESTRQAGLPQRVLEIGGWDFSWMIYLARQWMQDERDRWSMLLRSHVDPSALEQAIRRFGSGLGDLAARTEILDGSPAEVLAWLITQDDHWESLDAVILHAPRQASDFLIEACMAWKLLRPGGVMVIHPVAGKPGRECRKSYQRSLDSFMGAVAADMGFAHRRYETVLFKSPANGLDGDSKRGMAPAARSEVSDQYRPDGSMPGNLSGSDLLAWARGELLRSHECRNVLEIGSFRFEEEVGLVRDWQAGTTGGKWTRLFPSRVDQAEMQAIIRHFTEALGNMLRLVELRDGIPVRNMAEMMMRDDGWENHDVIILHVPARSGELLTEACMAWHLLRPGGIMILQPADHEAGTECSRWFDGMFESFATAMRDRIQFRDGTSCRFLWKAGAEHLGPPPPPMLPEPGRSESPFIRRPPVRESGLSLIASPPPGKRIKLLTFYSESHKHIYEEFFLPSYEKFLKGDFDLNPIEIPQVSKTGAYGNTGFEETMLHKIRHILDHIDVHEDVPLVFSDCDVQFFGNFRDDIIHQLSGLDIVFQDDIASRCAGFFACRQNKASQDFFELVLETLDSHCHKATNTLESGVSDQHIMNSLIDAKAPIKSGVLPKSRYFTAAAATGPRQWTGSAFHVPRGILVHHANWTVGVERKIRLLQFVRANAKPVRIVKPLNDGHAGDTFRELVDIWEVLGLVEVEYSPATPYVWWGGVGEYILYDRPTLQWLKHLPPNRGILYGNTVPHGGQGWIFWPRRPQSVERAIAQDLGKSGNRDIPSIFLGRVENPIQQTYRSDPGWAEVVDLFEMPVGTEARYTQAEYLALLGRSKFGLCLRGFGPKCNREVELMAMGTVPVLTPGIDLTYYEPPIEGTHYLFCGNPADFRALTESVSPEKWDFMSKNCKDWYVRNCSPRGSFDTTMEVIDRMEYGH
jgi:lipopolysaccharide biosynthesis glycosyltransferase/predicted O-methyltransferase YrrM